jgi:DHA2 family multidrug resistance protein-like MFS transporter
VLLPESRSAQRPSVDVLGVILSSAWLAGLTYGFIQADQDGWTNATALGTIAAGVVLLALFVAWERRLTSRESADARRGRPLIELRLFRSAGFTWGTTLATLVSFAMFGIFYAMPQYFQEVQGANAMGSGLRLLPLIGGLVVGMIGSTRLASPRRSAGGVRAPLASVKALVAVVSAILALIFLPRRADGFPRIGAAAAPGATGESGLDRAQLAV